MISSNGQEPREFSAAGPPGLAGTFSEAELTRLALSAEPLEDLDETAIPMDVFLATKRGPLPDWYMPAPIARAGVRWRIPIVGVIVFAFVLIEILGLCNTFGQLQLP